MRILYHHRIRSKDGQFVHLEEMIHALRGLGHEIEIVGPRHVEDERFGADAGVVASLKRWLPGAAYETLELSYSVADYRRLAAAIRRFRPDVIYERYNLYFPSGLWARRRYGLPLLLEVNAPLFDERSRFGGIALPRLARWSERYAWREADLVLPVTEVLAGRVMAAGVPRERIRVIANGINEEAFSGLPDRAAAKRRFGLADRFVLGFVGFMRDWHGLDRVLRVMKDHPRGDLHALFVGDGPDRDRLERIAAELGLSSRLTITGVVDRDQVPAAIAAFDVALQPAVVEYASPLKLFEYLYVGLPILAPDSPNIREVLSDGENGLLFDPGDDASFRRALGRLLLDDDLRDRLAARGRETVRLRDLTWSGNARRVTRLAEELAGGRAQTCAV
ncbi:MAG TPA: glycosyltransferase family 4 protein [Steroidobacteraceae bacterium]